MHMPGRRKLNLAAGKAHSLEAAVVGRVRSPARHPRDVKLAVPGIETSAMNARAELAGQGNHGALRLAVDFLAKHEEVRASPETEMQKLAFQRPKPAIGDGHLATARVVEAARKVDKR